MRFGIKAGFVIVASLVFILACLLSKLGCGSRDKALGENKLRPSPLLLQLLP
jgi:hypothetical protein